MNTDRELLEMAAKAAGYELEWESVLPGEDPDGYVGCDCIIKGTRRFWNPLTNDGDALRLAVKLVIDIKPPRSEDDDAQARRFDADEGVFERQETCPNAATRRAIVRAAAEIGRAMPAAKAEKGGDHE